MKTASLFRAIHREWRLAFSDSVTLVTFVVVGLLTLLALSAGSLRMSQRIQWQQNLASENSLQKEFLESSFMQDEKSEMREKDLTQTQIDRKYELQYSANSPDLMRYVSGVWWSVYPAPPLSSLSLGVSEKWPAYYHHEGISLAETALRPKRVNPMLMSWGAFDLTLFVGAILPIAVIVLTYNIVAADIEQQRWLLVSLHAKSIGVLILLRAFVRIGSLGAIVITITALYKWIAVTGNGEEAFLIPLLGWSLWVALYLGFWMSLSLCVNSFQMSSSGCGLALMACWCVLVITIPTLLQAKVNHDYPISPQTDLIAFEDKLRKQTEQGSEKIWASFLQQHPEITLDPENLQQEYLLRDIAIDRYVRSEVKLQLESYYQHFLDRESTLDRSQFFSPLFAWKTASDQLAGTSLRQYVDFAQQTTVFHETYLRYFEQYSIAGKELSAVEVSSIPEFASSLQPIKQSVTSLAYSAVSLFVWIAITCGIGWSNFRKPRPQ